MTRKILFCWLLLPAIVAAQAVDGRPNYSTQVRTANEQHSAELTRIAQEMGTRWIEAVNTLQSLSTYSRSISNALKDDYGQQQFSALVVRFNNMTLDPTLSQQISTAANRVRADVGKITTKAERPSADEIGLLVAQALVGQAPAVQSEFNEAFSSEPAAAQPARMTPLSPLRVPSWEEIKQRWLAEVQAEIDALEAADIEAINRVLAIQAAAIAGKQSLETMGAKGSSQWSYLHRMDLRPSQTDQFLQKLARELATDFSK